MARDEETPEEVAPQIVEREINLTLLNNKLNEITNLLYEIADKLSVGPAPDNH